MWPTLVLFLFFPCRNFCAENFLIFFCEIKLLFTYLPFRNVLESIVYNGKTLGIPAGVANNDVVCAFEKGN